MIGFFIKRRVTVSMIYLLIMLLGIVAWSKLPKEFMPNLEFPQLTVITSYQHASSQEVENLVTKAIEEAAGTVRGVRRIYSTSREGVSFVTVEFIWGTDMDFASLNLREKIDLAKAKLPREAKDPRIERFNPFAMPVMILSLSGNRTTEELLEYAKRPVSEMLEKVSGVAQVSIMGGREREIKIELEKDRLAAHKISIVDVVDAVNKSNITFPAGVIKDKVFEYTVRIMGVFKKSIDIGLVAVPILHKDVTISKNKNNEINLNNKRKRMVNVNMLGSIKDGFKDRSSYSRYDKRENISLSILKQGESYIVDAAQNTREKIKSIQQRLPKDLSLKIVYDQSVYIKQGINDLISNGIIGAFLAFIVMLLFLGNMRDSLVVCISIPLSILTALFLLHVKGITINTISLAGLILGVGQLVDASIVVQENIVRHRLTLAPTEASLIGAKEVLGAVFGSVLTTVVVFLPLIFVPGIIGQVFNDLSWAIVFSLSASLVIAFTLVPMLSSILPNTGQSSEYWTNLSNKAADTFRFWYKKILFYCFKNFKHVLGAFFLITLVCLLILAGGIKSELFPKVTEQEFMIKIDMPVGTNLFVTDRVANFIEELLLKREDVEHCSITVGSVADKGVQILGKHQAQVVVQLKYEHRKSLDDIMNKIRMQLTSPDIVSGLSYEESKNALVSLEAAVLTFSRQGGTFQAIASQGGGLPGYGKPILIEINGYDLDEMDETADFLKKELNEIPGLKDVGTSISVPGPEVVIEVNKDALALYNLTVAKLAETVLTAVKGKTASKYREEGKEIDILVRLKEKDKNTLDELGSLLIPSPLGIHVPLDAVAKIRKGEGPSEIIHINQERTVMVYSSLQGISLEHAAKSINNILDKVRKDKPNLNIVLAGESAQVKESSKSLKIIVILSLLFVYMVMASEFESMWQPFLILFTIPLSLIGIVPGLLISGHKLSVMSGMGIVLVAGLVVNNGIVLIDFINSRLDQELSLEEILFNASMTRVRPIMMTALTAVAGLFPLMLNLRGNSDMQAPMATVVIWGLFASTFLTLIVIPTLFFVSKKYKP
ncbi:efflux RND transporter permease subunit [bacterium]